MVASDKSLLFVDDNELNRYPPQALLSELITGVSIAESVFVRYGRCSEMFQISS